MKLQLPDSRDFLRWLPRASTIETGETTMVWRLDIGPRYDNHRFVAPVDLKYLDVRVEVQSISDSQCSILCRASAKSRRIDLHYAGYRALLIVDRFLGQVITINGVERAEIWFIVLAHYVEHGGPQVYDMTELMKSAQSNDADRLKDLIAKGADVNATDLIGTTALAWAALSGSYAAFSLLLEHGADPKTVESDGKALMHLAALGGDVRILSDLIRLGLDVNPVDLGGNTPLAFAVIKRKPEAAAALLRAGADPSAGRGIDICHEARLAFGADNPVVREICAATQPRQGP